VTRVKVCGITRFEDAELSVELGAWALGFILWPGSKRAVELPVAAGIGRRLRRRTQLVGVFVNASLDEIALASDAVGFTHVQLHGDEGPAFCTAVGQRTGARVIKAARIASGADLQALEPFHTDLHLLDGAGGSPWDWRLIRRRRSRVPVVLAGGLTPENVAEAITAVSPYAVDTASGTEASPGVKDPARLQEFFRSVVSAGRPAGGAAAPLSAGSPTSPARA
jgi:phosphoribosylanthranilate isomerase